MGAGGAVYYMRSARKSKVDHSLHHRQEDGALQELEQQAWTATFYAPEELSSSIRCPTRPVRFPLPLLATVAPLRVIFCWLPLQTWVWLCLAIHELCLCERQKALMMSDIMPCSRKQTKKQKNNWRLGWSPETLHCAWLKLLYLKLVFHLKIFIFKKNNSSLV